MWSAGGRVSLLLYWMSSQLKLAAVYQKGPRTLNIHLYLTLSPQAKISEGGRMDVRKVGHNCRHLCWSVSWSPDACCGPTDCLSWQSHVGAPGCRGTWRPWGQRWSRPQLKPGTGLACCHPAKRNHNRVMTLSIRDKLISHNPPLLLPETVSLTAKAPCTFSDTFLKLWNMLLWNTSIQIYWARVQQTAARSTVWCFTCWLKGVTLHTCLSAKKKKKNSIFILSTCSQVFVTKTCV